MAAVELAKTLPAARPRWRDYLALTKPRVVALMAFTVVVGMLLSARPPPWQPLLLGTLGIALVAGAAAALNHLVDRRLDARMARTRGRPLPRGALGPREVAGFAALLGAAGLALLLAFTNLLCALLTLASLLGYAVVYSLFLKHATPQNIVIGGAAGAAPPLLGWVAITGHIEAGALLLFLIIFVWTPPHFWALAIHRRDDYAQAGVPMLPVTHGVAFTAARVLAYTLALLPISLLPVAIGMSGWPYLVAALLLGLGFIAQAWRLTRDARRGLPTFRFSILYLAGLFAALLADRYLPG
ncbi:MAG: protoheme IX farnesyltransferase [Comamonadaceae bacterium]|nr:protoheme IX farnesyltransferase [Comamonadaceae bacterium]